MEISFSASSLPIEETTHYGSQSKTIRPDSMKFKLFFGFVLSLIEGLDAVSRDHIHMARQEIR